MKTFKMNETDFREWMTALRSGEYRQDFRKMKTKNGYCCLGVLCEIKGETIIIDRDIVPLHHFVKKWNINSLITPSGSNDEELHWANDDSRGFNPWVKVPEEYVGESFTFKFNDKDVHVASIASLNDAGFTFNQIADILEQHVEFN